MLANLVIHGVLGFRISVDNVRRIHGYLQIVGYPLFWASIFTVNWITTLLALDIYFASNHPFKYIALSTNRRWRIATVCFAIYAIIYETFWGVMGYKIECRIWDEDDEAKTIYECIRDMSDFGKSYNFVDAYIKFVTHIILPTGIQIFTCIFTARALFKQNMETEKVLSGDEISGNSEDSHSKRKTVSFMGKNSSMTIAGDVAQSKVVKSDVRNKDIFHAYFRSNFSCPIGKMNGMFSKLSSKVSPRKVSYVVSLGSSSKNPKSCGKSTPTGLDNIDKGTADVAQTKKNAPVIDPSTKCHDKANKSSQSKRRSYLGDETDTQKQSKNNEQQDQGDATTFEEFKNSPLKKTKNGTKRLSSAASKSKRLSFPDKQTSTQEQRKNNKQKDQDDAATFDKFKHSPSKGKDYRRRRSSSVILSKRHTRDQSIVRLALVIIAINLVFNMPGAAMHLLSVIDGNYWEKTDWALPWCLELVARFADLIQHMSNPFIYFVMKKQFRDQAAIVFTSCKTQ